MPLNINNTFSSMKLRDGPSSHMPTQTSPSSKTHPMPSDESGLYTVYIGDLPPTYNEAQLAQLMRANTSMPVLIKICRDINSDESYRYGFLKFNTYQEAEKAINDMTFTEIDGYTIRLIHYDKHKKLDKDANIFVKNLTPNSKARTIYEFLQVLGPVQSIKIPTIVEKNGQIRRLNYCYIQFETKEHADRAISLINETTIDGSHLQASKFEPVKIRNQKLTNNLDYIIKYVPKEMPEEVLLRELNLELVDVASVEEPEKYIKELNEKQINAVTRLDLSAGKKNLNYVFCFITFYSPDTVEITRKKITSLNSKFELNADIEGYVHKKNSPPLALDKVLTKAELINKKRETSLKQESKRRRKNIYIRGIPKSYTEEDFKKLCSEFGDISSVWLPKREIEDETEINKGYGYCCFIDEDSARKAIECLNGLHLETRKLYVTLASSFRERTIYSNSPQMSGGRSNVYGGFHNQHSVMGYSDARPYQAYPQVHNIHNIHNVHNGRRDAPGGRKVFHPAHNNPGGRKFFGNNGNNNSGVNNNGEKRYGGGYNKFSSGNMSLGEGSRINNNMNLGDRKVNAGGAGETILLERIEKAAIEECQIKPNIVKLLSNTMVKVYGEANMKETLEDPEAFRKLVARVLETIQSENEG